MRRFLSALYDGVLRGLHGRFGLAPDSRLGDPPAWHWVRRS